MTGPYHWLSDHAFSHRGAVAAYSVLPRPFRHHGLQQHAKLPCPSLSSWACSDLFPLSRWCHPTISFSVAPFSSCSQSFSVSGSFPKSRLFTSGEQSIGALASKSVLPLNIQSWFPLGLTDLISLLSQGALNSFLQHHSLKASILQCSAFFIVQLSQLCVSDYWKNQSFDHVDLCWQGDVSAFQFTV